MEKTSCITVTFSKASLSLEITCGRVCTTPNAIQRYWVWDNGVALLWDDEQVMYCEQ